MRSSEGQRLDCGAARSGPAEAIASPSLQIRAREHLADLFDDLIAERSDAFNGEQRTSLRCLRLGCSNPYAGKNRYQPDDEIDSYWLADQLGRQQSRRDWIDGHGIGHSGWRRPL